MDLAYLQELVEYHSWANDRLLRAVEALPDEAYRRDLKSSFPSVQATLAHLMTAEAIWLSRWTGDPIPAVKPEEVPTPADARGRWSALEGRLRAFVGGLTQADLDREVTFRVQSGKEFHHPFREMLAHLFNHGTYHRGQVVTMLRQLGAEAPATDLILYYRHRSGQL